MTKKIKQPLTDAKLIQIEEKMCKNDKKGLQHDYKKILNHQKNNL